MDGGGKRRKSGGGIERKGKRSGLRSNIGENGVGSEENGSINS